MSFYYLPDFALISDADSAAAFHGFTPALVPYGQSHEKILKLLQTTGVDYVIAAAGSLPLSELKKQMPSIKEVLWVVEKTSREMDWSEPSEGAYTMHEIIEAKLDTTSTTLPEHNSEDHAPDIETIWLNDGFFSGEAFSQKVREVLSLH